MFRIVSSAFPMTKYKYVNPTLVTRMNHLILVNVKLLACKDSDYYCSLPSPLIYNREFCVQHTWIIMKRLFRSERKPIKELTLVLREQSLVPLSCTYFGNMSMKQLSNLLLPPDDYRKVGYQFIFTSFVINIYLPTR